MKRSLEFAPLSGGPSGRLRLASGYFVFTGAVTILVTVVSAIAIAAGTVPWQGPAVLLGIAINLTLGALYVLIGRMLARRSRKAGIAAIALLALPLIELALGGRASHFAVLLSLIGLAVMLSVWDELRRVPDPA